MAYSDFTIEKVNQDFHLRVTATAFLGEVAAVQPSEWLVESLRRRFGPNYGHRKGQVRVDYYAGIGGNP